MTANGNFDGIVCASSYSCLMGAAFGGGVLSEEECLV